MKLWSRVKKYFCFSGHLGKKQLYDTVKCFKSDVNWAMENSIRKSKHMEESGKVINRKMCQNYEEEMTESGQLGNKKLCQKYQEEVEKSEKVGKTKIVQNDKEDMTKNGQLGNKKIC